MKKNVFYLLGIILLMVSCYPDDSVSYDDTDIVYTNYNDTYPFASKGTYAIPDEIVKITGNLAEGQDPEFLDNKYSTQILNRIESNMTALGWTKADKETADLILLPAVWTNTTIVYWYDYWCWYYYCGWGWYYPSYSSYTTGTMVMGLVASGAEYVEPDIVWFSAINGLLSGAYDVSRVNNAVDQAFEQSPYLDTK